MKESIQTFWQAKDGIASGTETIPWAVGSIATVRWYELARFETDGEPYDVDVLVGLDLEGGWPTAAGPIAAPPSRSNGGDHALSLWAGYGDVATLQPFGGAMRITYGAGAFGETVVGDLSAGTYAVPATTATKLEVATWVVRDSGVPNAPPGPPQIREGSGARVRGAIVPSTRCCSRSRRPLTRTGSRRIDFSNEQPIVPPYRTSAVTAWATPTGQGQPANVRLRAAQSPEGGALGAAPDLLFSSSQPARYEIDPAFYSPMVVDTEDGTGNHLVTIRWELSL